MFLLFKCHNIFMLVKQSVTVEQTPKSFNKESVMIKKSVNKQIMCRKNK